MGESATREKESDPYRYLFRRRFFDYANQLMLPVVRKAEIIGFRLPVPDNRLHFPFHLQLDFPVIDFKQRNARVTVCSALRRRDHEVTVAILADFERLDGQIFSP